MVGRFFRARVKSVTEGEEAMSESFKIWGEWASNRGRPGVCVCVCVCVCVYTFESGATDWLHSNKLIDLSLQALLWFLFPIFFFFYFLSNHLLLLLVVVVVVKFDQQWGTVVHLRLLLLLHHVVNLLHRFLIWWWCVGNLFISINNSVLVLVCSGGELGKQFFRCGDVIMWKQK